MNPIPARYCDGRSARSVDVGIFLQPGGSILIRGEGIELRVEKQDYRLAPASGSTPRIFHFPGDQICESDAHHEIRRDFESGGRRAFPTVALLESRWSLAIAALAAVLLAVALFVAFGIPGLAKHVAFALPEQLNQQIGRETFQILEKTWLSASELPDERKAELHERFRAMLAEVGDAAPYRLEFRKSKVLGANALALPSGVIVVTDGLVEIARQDEEILAVLAHECGHIQHRHSLRLVLQHSGVLLLSALILGDLSAAGTFAGSLPSMLIQARHSRSFETEADATAVAYLEAAGIPPAVFASMLRRLAGERSTQAEETLRYFRSHPPTEERIRRFQQ